MTDYIFNFAENNKYLEEHKECTTKKHQRFELLVYIKGLILQKINKEQIFERVININCWIFKGTKDEDELKYIFDKIYEQAVNWEIPISGKDIVIYQEEIDYINQLDCLMWLKQYIFALLCIYKYYGNKWCSFNKYLRSFAFSCTHYKIERDHHKYCIQILLQKEKLYDFSDYNGELKLKVNFATQEGVSLITFSSPREVEKYLYLLKNEKSCINCGAVYEFTSRNWRVGLCPLCYKKKIIITSNTTRKKKYIKKASKNT